MKKKNSIIYLDKNNNNNDPIIPTFKTHKLKNKKIEIRTPYHLNVVTYELEETY